MFLYWRQFQAIRNSKVPKYMTEKVTEEEYEKTKNYNKEKLIFSTITAIIYFIKSFSLIYFGLIPYFYHHLDTRLGWKSDMLTQIAFLLIWYFLDLVFDIPFSLWSTFVIEEKYGFNKSSLIIFFTDMAKSCMLISVILPILFGMVFKIIEFFDTFFWKVTIFIMIFQIAMIIILPIFIMPLYNKFVEMEEGTLKTRVIELANKVKFRYSNIFVMDGSKRSGHSNAFFIGLFREKRIVFYDTLIEQSTEDEAIAILGHELGHWYHLHMPRMLFVQFSLQALSIYFFEIAVKNSHFSLSIFGTEKVPILLKMIYFSMVSQMISPMLVLLSNMLSRYNEKQADRFAVSHGFSDDLIHALISLHKENRSSLTTDWMYSAYYHSHPTLDERISFITEAKMLLEKKEE